MARTEVHPTPAARESTPFVCGVCGDRFATHRALRDHVRSVGLVC